jgi:hypothetical protein
MGELLLLPSKPPLAYVLVYTSLNGEGYPTTNALVSENYSENLSRARE